MNCPHCGQRISGRPCPSCGSEVFEESLFCHRCGSKLEKAEAKPIRVEGEEVDFSRRILCSDGTCIGVVNEQGVCKVCGKPYTGDPS
jgi:predicted amidophosphoribosyltransferase